MDKEQIGVIKLEILHKLIEMYVKGTGKEANHKNEKGGFEIIDFIKDFQPLLKAQGMKITLENDHEFIEKFFQVLFKYKK